MVIVAYIFPIQALKGTIVFIFQKCPNWLKGQAILFQANNSKKADLAFLKVRWQPCRALPETNEHSLPTL